MVGGSKTGGIRGVFGHGGKPAQAEAGQAFPIPKPPATAPPTSRPMWRSCVARACNLESGCWSMAQPAAWGLACVDLAKRLGCPGDRRVGLGRQAARW